MYEEILSTAGKVLIATLINKVFKAFFIIPIEYSGPSKTLGLQIFLCMRVTELRKVASGSTVISTRAVWFQINVFHVRLLDNYNATFSGGKSSSTHKSDGKTTLWVRYLCTIIPPVYLFLMQSSVSVTFSSGSYQ